MEKPFDLLYALYWRRKNYEALLLTHPAGWKANVFGAITGLRFGLHMVMAGLAISDANIEMFLPSHPEQILNPKFVSEHLAQLAGTQVSLVRGLMYMDSYFNVQFLGDYVDGIRLGLRYVLQVYADLCAVDFGTGPKMLTARFCEHMERAILDMQQDLFR